MAAIWISSDAERVLSNQQKIYDLVAEGKTTEALFLVAYDSGYICKLLYEKILEEQSERAIKQLPKLDEALRSGQPARQSGDNDEKEPDPT